MDISAQRPLTRANLEWSLPQLSSALRASLYEGGPALAFGSVNLPSVASHIALVITTSGSTGIAKQVALSGAALLASAKAANEYLGAKPGDRWSLVLPVEHIAAINVLVRALELGGIAIDNREATSFEPAEFVSIVPTQLHRAINGDHPLLQHLQGAKAVLVGGAATNNELITTAALNGINVVTTYGMTEMCGGCIYNGAPLNNTEVRILENGNIQLKGSSMANGYLNFPDLWTELSKDGWFTTSDLGEIIEGKLVVLGRNDDQIISGGKKISLSAIELIAKSRFPNQEFIAFALTDLEWGQRLALASDRDISIAEINSAIRSKFGGYAVPKEFHVVNPLPVKGIGKPDRNRLVEIFSTPIKDGSHE